MKRQLLVIPLVLLMTVPPPLFGWNGLGHMAVAYVAYQHLDQTRRDRVAVLLRRNPDYSKWLTKIPPGTSLKDRRMMLFMIAATWPDQIRNKPGYTDDGTDDGNRPSGPTSSQNIGYRDHLHHKYWHFANVPFSQDGTALPETPSPSVQTQIDAFRVVLASDARDSLKSYDLVWLLHLVGDVHQPLHAANRVTASATGGDHGGNMVKLCAAPCRSQLHGFWDDLLTSSSDPADALRVAQTLPDADAIRATDLDTETWMREAKEFARQDVYVDPIAAGEGPFAITQAYRDAAKELARKQVALAGTRLANLLNAELQ
jgi:hypothetical protein